jgi:hypothetical protein
MKRTLIVGLAAGFCGAIAIAAQTAEPVDAAAIAKIRDEGLNRSQVMETLHWLTDRHGPRLTGSPAFEEAGDWAIQQLTTWGIANARKERFAFGRGWTLDRFHATMTAPRVMPIIGMPKAWTPGTGGVKVAEVVRPQITSQAECEAARGKLRGKIVLTQPARPVEMLDQAPVVLRMDDEDGKMAKEALTMPPPRGGGSGGRGGGGRGGGGGGGRGRGDAATGPVEPCVAVGQVLAATARGRGAATDPDDPDAADNPPAGRAGGGGGGGNNNAVAAALLRFYKSEGVLALFDRGSDNVVSAGGSDLTWRTQRVDGGTVFVQSGGRRQDAPDATLPQVTLAVEHYNRMVRLLEHGTPVSVELDVAARFIEETPARLNGFNVVAELAGTDKADEIVVIGGHFDSWHGATGATDNATGCAAMMEVLRILQATGLKPRRTIRIGLWGAEEGGLIGSQAYVLEHLGTAQQPKPEYGKTSAYFNLDNGTGRIRGIWMQSNEAIEPVFRAWIAPLKDLGVDILAPRSVASTDHTRFDAVGVPAFQFVQERYEYNSRTHHSNMDFLDRVQPDDMKQMATVVAVFAWHAANREGLLPRKPAGR